MEVWTERETCGSCECWQWVATLSDGVYGTCPIVSQATERRNDCEYPIGYRQRERAPAEP